MRLTVTQADTIYSGDNLSKKITFLVPANASGIDIQAATLFLIHIRADGLPDITILERDANMYNDSYYQYVLPVTCRLSKYPGEVCMWLSIYFGNHKVPSVAQSGECMLRILSKKTLDDCIVGHQLTAFYQLKKQIDNMVENDSRPGDSSGDSSEDEDGYGVVEF